MIASLTLLGTGQDPFQSAIADIFHPRRSVPIPTRPQHDPLALPTVPNQCVHVEIIYVDGVPSTSRCLLNATPTRNGWLCDSHTNLMEPVRTPVLRGTSDRDLEAAEGIILYDARAIAKGSGVRLSKKSFYHVPVDDVVDDDDYEA